jgi:Transposase family tnp2
MMASLLISDSKQQGNNINVFLTLLVENLDKLWRDDVHTYNIFCMKEQFII